MILPNVQDSLDQAPPIDMKRRRIKLRDAKCKKKNDQVYQNHITTGPDLDNYLMKYAQSDPEKRSHEAVQFFFDRQTFAFDAYCGHNHDVLYDVLVKTKCALSTCADDINGYFRNRISKEMLRKGEPTEYDILRLFRLNICRQSGTRTPTPHEVSTIISLWESQLDKGLKHLATFLNHLLSPEHQVKLSVRIVRALRIRDEDYMKKFLKMLTLLGSPESFQSLDTDDKRTQEDVSRCEPADCSDIPFPFVFICSPSGSGKSVFGINLGAHVPVLHWIHKTEDPDQEEYVPLQPLSDLINNAALQDLKCEDSPFKDYHSANIDNIIDRMYLIPFEHSEKCLF